MATWQELLDDNFARGTTSVGAAGNIISVGANWIDVPGSIWHLVSGVLVPTTTSTVAFGGSALLRPTQENLINTRYVVDYAAPPSQASGTADVFLHYIDSSNYYLVRFTAFFGGSITGRITILRRVANVLTTLGSGTSGLSINATHTYKLDVNCTTTTGVTTISASMVDTTTSTTLDTFTAPTDSSAAIQGAGQHGIAVDQPAGGVHGITRIRVYYDNTAGMVPTTQTVSPLTTLNIAFTGSSTSWSGSTVLALTNASALATLNSQSNASSTSQTINVDTGTAVGSFLVSDSVSGAKHVVIVYGASMTTNPTFVDAGNATKTIVLTGSGTTWNGSTTFSVTGSGGASGVSLVSTTIDSAMQATLVINTGTASGTITILQVGTLTAKAIPVYFKYPFTSDNLFISPYNWGDDGSGTPNANGVRPASTIVKTVYPGAYIKFTFSGTMIGLGLDTSSGQYWTFRYSIDGGRAADITCTSETFYTLASGLANTTHKVSIWTLDCPSGSDRWTTTQPNSFLVTAIRMIGTAGAAPTLRPKRMLSYGDSIQEGSHQGEVTTSAEVEDAFQTISYHMAYGLEAEFGVVGVGGQGYYDPGLSNVPAMFTSGSDTNTSWNKMWSGLYRTFTGGSPALGGQFLVAPDYIFSFHGTNDYQQSDANVQASVNGWLAGIRVAAPLAKIFVCVAPNQAKVAAVTAGFNQYQAATPDTACYLIDLGDLSAEFVFARLGVENFASVDDTHPRKFVNARLACRYMAKVVPHLAAVVSGGVRKISNNFNGGI